MTMPISEIERRKIIKTLKEALLKGISSDNLIPKEYENARITCNKEKLLVEISGPITMTYDIKSKELYVRNKSTREKSDFINIEVFNRFKIILNHWNVHFFGQ